MLRYIPDPRGAELLLSSAEMRGALAAAAEAAMEHAISIAPVVTGEYAASFSVQEMGGNIFIVNTSDHAAAVEWGTSDTNQARHVLARAVDWLEGE